MRKRGHYDRATIDEILDAGVLCHVGFVVDSAPIVIPTLYWRDGDWIYLHGSSANRMLGTALGAPACVTVTHLDGLVLTRSAFHHSANYRSVVILGEPEDVADPKEREAAMKVFMESLFPGRWDSLRPVKSKELKATRLLRLRIDEASAKIRTGPPSEDAADLGWPAWGGIIPLTTRVGEPEADEHVKAPGLSAPRLRKFRG
jgi:nitroimidazol reductase NimA-like FMN-containing flavoprotein (pyridoxamine 5'-phosphate oxidase superfamily)